MTGKVEVEARAATSHSLRNGWSMWVLIKGYWRALVFLLRLVLDYYTDYEEKKEAIGKYEGLVYRPGSRGQKSSKGVVVIVPGLSPSGYEDIRIKQLAMAVAGCGFTGVIPCLDSYRKLEINMGQVEGIVNFCEQIVAHRTDLCPSGNVSVAGACISAGFSLVASTKFAFRSVLCIGTYASAQAVAEENMLDEKEDDYGRNAMFYNFHYLYEGRKEGMQELFYARILDNHLETNEIESNTLTEAAVKHPREYEEFKKLHADIEFRQQVVQKLTPQMEKFLIDISPIYHVKEMNSELFVLVHGLDDSVVISSESNALYQKFQLANKPSTLCLTPLLEHANKQTPGLGMIGYLIDLVQSFSDFFIVADDSTPIVKDKTC